jgi:alkylation response protein AidB-like acyl-CoA dehydrogenase
MAGEFADFHEDLKSVAADLLGKGSGEPIDWPLLVQAGWVGLEAPDDVAGAGATFAEVAIILEQMGRTAARTSYLGGAALSIGALNLLRPNELRDELLEQVASGSIRAAVALAGDNADTPFTITTDLRVSGRADFVPDAGDAQRLLVPARDTSGTTVLVDIPAAELQITDRPVLDETRRFADVAADGVAVGAASVWAFAGDPRSLVDRAAVAVACDSLGVSEAMLAATVSYTAVRHQFDRPIGSFQAVKHACADMLVRIAVSRQLVQAAVDAVAEGSPDASTAVSVAASMGKAYATQAAVDITGKAMQLHGGIGYTWESGVHVYLKRAALNRSLFGSPAEHRRTLARRYTG